MPSIKQKEDATLSLIQRFIRPSCTAPGLRIGIWSWLDNQEIPSSDKWGFFLSIKGAEGVCFPQGLWNTERNWSVGLRVFPYGHMKNTGNTAKHACKELTISHTYTCCAFKKQRTETYPNYALEAGCRAARRPQQRLSTEEAVRGTWKRAVMWNWHDTRRMRQMLSICLFHPLHGTSAGKTFSHRTNRPG